ncbi:hypothetical protein ACRRS0_05020 [Agarivorans sp. QJM3NY_29]|uniref:hypothetical protein n=1 Tax=unclassified Agarivorans TaxID=2636026 RepID=UPI003D7D4A74
MMKWMLIGISLLFGSANAEGLRVWLQTGNDSQWMEMSDLQVQSSDGSLKQRMLALDVDGKPIYLSLSELAFIQAANRYYYVSNQYVAITHSGLSFKLPAPEQAKGLFVARNSYGGYTSFDYSALRRIIFSQ